MRLSLQLALWWETRVWIPFCRWLMKHPEIGPFVVLVLLSLPAWIDISIVWR